MARKTRSTKRGRSRRFASPPEAHEEGLAKHMARARESLDHARNVLDVGDCAGGLTDLTAAAQHVGAAESEAKGAGSRGSGAASRLHHLKDGLAEVSAEFEIACLRRK